MNYIFLISPDVTHTNIFYSEWSGNITLDIKKSTDYISLSFTFDSTFNNYSNNLLLPTL